MKSFKKFEKFIIAYCQDIHRLTAVKGLNTDTLVTLYRHFVSQLVPFDESEICCAAGCGYCCHLKVTASVAEILVLVDFLKKNEMLALYTDLIPGSSPPVIDRSGEDVSRWMENNVPCIFLDPDKLVCNIYEVRPFTCRAYHSLDVAQCRAGYVNRTVTPIPCYADLKRSREMYSVSLQLAMAEMNLQSFQMELSSTALFFLQDADRIDRWLAGEWIFD